MFVFNIIIHLVLDILVSIFIFIPSRLIKYCTRKPFDKWIFKEKPNVSQAIVLVHGSGATESQFLFARQYIEKLSKHGVRLYSCDLDINNQCFANSKDSIEDYANKLETYIRLNVLNKKTDRLILIGHSMGGLVAGFIVDRLKIHTLITIGTPWQGVSRLKYFRWIPWLRTKRHTQMLPNSIFLERCIDKIKNNDIKLITFGCKYDIQVLEKEAHIEEIQNLIKYTSLTLDAGHCNVIVFPKTWEKILRLLDL